MKQDIEKKIAMLAPLSRMTMVAEFLSIPYHRVVRVVNRLRREGKMGDVTVLALNATQMQEILDTGKVKTVTTYFSPSHGQVWSKMEDDFIGDNVGVLSDFEMAHWLGRTERAIQMRRLRLELDHFEESGYFCTEQVIACLQVSKYRLSRDKKAGRITTVDHQPVRKDIECSAGKLRYSLKELTREGKEVFAFQLPSLFKGKRFARDYYTSDAVSDYISMYGTRSSYPCLICGKPSNDSSLCLSCE